MKDELQVIMKRIDEIIRNDQREPLDMLGSYIVGATIVRDDAEALFEAYPQLEEIAELGSDLETLGDSKYTEEIFAKIKEKFAIFSQGLEDNDKN